MVNCAVLGCLCRTEHNSENVSYHRFPSIADLRQVWINSTGRVDWHPTRNSRICSNHFEVRLLRKTNSKVFLTQSAVPTIDVHVQRKSFKTKTYKDLENKLKYYQREKIIHQQRALRYQKQVKHWKDLYREEQKSNSRPYLENMVEAEISDDENDFEDGTLNSGFHCNICKKLIIGERYTCVQCAIELCSSCSWCSRCSARSARARRLRAAPPAPPPHPAHYVLRSPTLKSHEEVHAIIIAIRKVLEKRGYALPSLKRRKHDDDSDTPADLVGTTETDGNDELAELKYDISGMTQTMAKLKETLDKEPTQNLQINTKGKCIVLNPLMPSLKPTPAMKVASKARSATTNRSVRTITVKHTGNKLTKLRTTQATLSTDETGSTTNTPISNERKPSGTITIDAGTIYKENAIVEPGLGTPETRSGTIKAASSIAKADTGVTCAVSGITRAVGVTSRAPSGTITIDAGTIYTESSMIRATSSIGEAGASTAGVVSKTLRVQSATSCASAPSQTSNEAANKVLASNKNLATPLKNIVVMPQNIIKMPQSKIVLKKNLVKEVECLPTIMVGSTRSMPKLMHEWEPSRDLVLMPKVGAGKKQSREHSSSTPNDSLDHKRPKLNVAKEDDIPVKKIKLEAVDSLLIKVKGEESDPECNEDDQHVPVKPKKQSRQNILMSRFSGKMNKVVVLPNSFLKKNTDTSAHKTL